MKVASVSLLVVLLTSLLPASAEPELRGKPEELKSFLQSGTRTVTLEGEGTERAVNDTARVKLAVTTEDKLLATALQANQTVRAAIVSALAQAGISSENAQSSKFSATPEHGWFGSKPSSFKVVNVMTVRVTDERQFQAVAGMADRFKEVQLADTGFEHSDREKAVTRARKAALDKIMATKSFYEKELGMKLQPVTFSARDSDFGGSSGIQEVIVSTRRRGASDEAEPDFELPEGFDEVEYLAKVSVTFEVTKAGAP